jgi:DNA-binding transcriptional ArsR family regulator
MPPTSAKTIQWDPKPRKLAADPAATFAVDRHTWKDLGARFRSFTDDLGGTSYIATGIVATPDGKVPIGILGNDEADTTFLLLAIADRATAQSVIEALFAAGIERTALLERLPAVRAPSIDVQVPDLQEALRKRRGRGDDRLDKALSHPIRVQIFNMLQQRPASPTELSKRLGTTLGATAYHVRTLHTLGLIELVEERQRRGGAVEHYYLANQLPTALGTITDSTGSLRKARARAS